MGEPQHLEKIRSSPYPGKVHPSLPYTGNRRKRLTKFSKFIKMKTSHQRVFMSGLSVSGKGGPALKTTPKKNPRELKGVRLDESCPLTSGLSRVGNKNSFTELSGHRLNVVHKSITRAIGDRPRNFELRLNEEIPEEAPFLQTTTPRQREDFER
ncbi:hypothetical protein TNCV_1377571 [Trichonephila clavipes]|nr:hypothetical protein TNCV_1377571 [Trichonephila clavipes]